MARKLPWYEKLCSEYLPFIIWGLAAKMLGWLFLGDYVKGV